MSISLLEIEKIDIWFLLKKNFSYKVKIDIFLKICQKSPLRPTIFRDGSKYPGKLTLSVGIFGISLPQRFGRNFER